MAVVLDQRTGRYWRMNAAASSIVTTLNTGVTVSALIAEYDIDIDTATRDVVSHIADLHARRLFERVNQGA